MGERDAFGREKDENTLAGMGWSSSSTPRISAEPVPAVEREASPDQPFAGTPAPPPASAPAPEPTVMSAGTAAGFSDAFRSAGVPRQRVRRVRPGRLFGPLILLAIIGAGIFGAGAAIQTGTDALDDFQGAIKDATTTTVTEPPAEAVEPEAVPAGASGGSLLRAAALKQALAKLPKGSLVTLRVAPDRIDAQVVVDGKMHVAQVTASGDVSDIGTPATVPAGGKVKVNSAAPYRIARTAARRAGRDVSDVSYLVLLNIAGKPQWQLYFEDGLHFSGSADGRKVRRIG